MFARENVSVRLVVRVRLRMSQSRRVGESMRKHVQAGEGNIFDKVPTIHETVGAIENRLYRDGGVYNPRCYRVPLFVVERLTALK